MKQVILILCSRMNPWILNQIKKWWTVKKQIWMFTFYITSKETSRKK